MKVSTDGSIPRQYFFDTNYFQLLTYGPQKFSKIRVLKVNYFHPPTHLQMNNEILIVFQCKKWFVYQTTWFKTHLLRFFIPENWHKLSILLTKNNNSIKIKPWFQFEVFFFCADEKNFITLIFENFWGPH